MAFVLICKSEADQVNQSHEPKVRRKSKSKRTVSKRELSFEALELRRILAFGLGFATPQNRDNRLFEIQLATGEFDSTGIATPSPNFLYGFSKDSDETGGSETPRNIDDKLIVGDWSGTGFSSLGAVRQFPSSVDDIALSFFLDTDRDTTPEYAFKFGFRDGTTVDNVVIKDTPVVGNFDGVNGDDIAVVRQGLADGLKWFVHNSKETTSTSSAFPLAARSVEASRLPLEVVSLDDEFWFGEDGDIPLAGRFDKDEIDDLVVVRKNSLNQWEWHIRLSTLHVGSTPVANRQLTADIAIEFGDASTTPIIGDWDGDGWDDLGTVKDVDELVAIWTLHRLQDDLSLSATPSDPKTVVFGTLQSGQSNQFLTGNWANNYFKGNNSLLFGPPTAGNRWSDETSWSSETVPQSGETVVIDQPSSVEIDFDAGEFSGTLQTSNRVNVTGGILTLQGESAVDVLNVTAGTVVIDGSTRVNSLIVSGGTVTFQGIGSAGDVVVSGGTLAVNQVLGASSFQMTSGLLQFGITNPLNNIDLTFSGGRIESTASSLRLDNRIIISNTVAFIANESFAIGREITGVGTFEKRGTSFINLETVNTYSGSTIISQGELLISQENGLAVGSSVFVAAGALLNLEERSNQLGALTGTGDVQIRSAGTLTIGVNDATSRFDGRIVATGSLNKVGAGTFTLGGVNTYTGGTIISGGSLVLGVSNALSPQSQVSISSSARLELLSNTATIGSLSGDGLLDVGSGTLTLNSPTTIGTIRIGGGRLITNANLTATQIVFSAAGGELTTDLPNTTPIDFVTINSSITFDGAARLGGLGYLVVSGLIAGSGSLEKIGTGSLVLVQGNSYSGLTTVNSGTLIAEHQSALGSSIASTVVNGGVLALGGELLPDGFDVLEPIVVNAEGRLDLLSNINLLAPLTVAGSILGDVGSIITGDISLTGEAIFSQRSSAAIFQLLGAITDSAGSQGIVFDSPSGGTVTLNNPSNSYRGTTRVQAGALRITASEVIPNTSSVTIANGALLETGSLSETFLSADVAGDISVGSGTLSILSDLLVASTGSFATTTGLIQVSGDFTNAGTFIPGTGTLEFNASSLSQSFDIGSSSVNNLLHSGSGTLQLQSDVNVTGTLSNTAGTIDLLDRTVTVAGAVTNNSGATIRGGSGTLRLSNSFNNQGTFEAGTGTLDFNAPSGLTQQFTAGAGSINNLVHSGAGTLQLQGDTIVGGSLSNTAGILDLGDQVVAVAGSVTNSSVATLRSGSGTLRLAGSFNNLGDFESGTGLLEFNAASGIQLLGLGNSSLNNVLHSGAGTLQLQSDLTVLGTLTNTAGTIDQGDRTVSVTAAVSNSPGATLRSGSGTLRLSSDFINLGAFEAGSGTLDFIAPSQTSQTFTIGASPVNNLTHSGAGTLQLQGSLNVSGTLSNTSGIMELGGNTVTVTGTVTNAQDATLQTAGTLRLAGDLTNLGIVVATTGIVEMTGPSGSTQILNLGSSSVNNLTHSGLGTVRLDSDLTVTGSLSNIAGTFELGDRIASVAGNLSNETGATLRSGSSTVRITGNFSNSGSFFAGSGTLDFNAPSDLTQQLISGSGSLNNVVHSGAGTLQLQTGLVINGSFTNNAGIVELNSGTVTVAGPVTNAQGSTLRSGTSTLRLANNFTNLGTFDAGTGTIEFNAASGLNQSLGLGNSSAHNLLHSGAGTLQFPNDLTLSGTLLNTAGVISLGNGVLSVNGDVSNSQSATIQAGEGIFRVSSNFINAGTFNPGAGTLEFNASSLSQSIDIGSSSVNNLLHSGSGTLQLQNDLNITGTLSNSAGVMDLLNRTVTVAGAVTNNSGATIRGGSGTLRLSNSFNNQGTFEAGTGTLDFNAPSGLTQQFTAGAGSLNNLVHSGAGTLQLQGDTIVGGSLSNTAGILDLGDQVVAVAGSVTNSSVATLRSGFGTLRLGANFSNLGIFESGTGTLEFNAVGGVQVLDIGGSSLNNLSHSGAGTFQLQSDLAVLGTLFNTAGIFDLGDRTVSVTGAVSNSLGATLRSGSGTLRLSSGFNNQGAFIAGNGTLDFNSPSGVTQQFTIGSSPVNNLTHSGPGTLELQDDLIVSGALANTAGILELGNNTVTVTGALSNSQAATLRTAGTLRLAGNVSSPGTLNATTATIELNGLSGTTQSLDLGGSSVNDLNHIGLGSVQLESDLDVTGNLANAAGVFELGDRVVNVAGTLSNETGATLRSGSTTIRIAGDFVNAGNFVAGTGLLDFNGSIGATQQLIGGGSSVNNVVHSGTGTLQLQAGLVVDGSVANTAGTIELSGGIVTVTGPVTNELGATFRSNNSTLRLASDFTNQGTLDAGTGTLDFNSNIGRQLVSTGGGSLFNLNHSGASTLVVASDLQLSNTLENSAGTIDIEGNQVSASRITLVAGTILDSQSSGSLIASNLFDLRGGEVSSNTSGIGRLVKSSNGNVVLSGNNRFTGSTTIEEGILKLDDAATFERVTGLLINQLGTFDLNNHSLLIDGLDGAGTVQLGTGNLIASISVSSDFGGNITGTGGLTKEGVGTLLLSGSSDYQGNTVVNQGSLTLSGTNAISETSDVAIASEGIFDIGSSQQAVRSIQGLGTLALTGGTLRIANDTQSVSYAGTIQGTGVIEKDMIGTLSLSGSGDFSGVFEIRNGTLQANGQFPNAAAIVSSGGSLQGDGILFDLTIASGGVLRPGNSPGALTVSNFDVGVGGTLVFEIGGRSPGSQYDQIIVSNHAILDGQIIVQLVDGYVPIDGEIFDLILFANFTGSPSLTIVDVGGVQNFNTQLLSNSYRLVTVSNIARLLEPPPGDTTEQSGETGNSLPSSSVVKIVVLEKEGLVSETHVFVSTIEANASPANVDDSLWLDQAPDFESTERPAPVEAVAIETVIDAIFAEGSTADLSSFTSDVRPYAEIELPPVPSQRKRRDPPPPVPVPIIPDPPPEFPIYHVAAGVGFIVGGLTTLVSTLAKARRTTHRERPRASALVFSKLSNRYEVFEPDDQDMKEAIHSPSGSNGAYERE